MPMTLREARCLFSANLARLVDHAVELGYEVAIGEVVRSPETARANAQQGTGIANSLHLLGLAVDLHLYRDGKYLARTEDHAQLGAFWKGLHERNRWGGDFKNRPDGNHYSFSWEGRA